MKRAPVVSLHQYRLTLVESSRIKLFRLVLDLIRDGDDESIKSQIENAESELRRITGNKDK